MLNSLLWFIINSFYFGDSGGEDQPRLLVESEFDGTDGKTVGLLLSLCCSVFHAAFFSVLDSVFCILKALITMKYQGILHLLYSK